MVGLGRMGGNMAERLRAAGHEVVGYANDGSGDVASLEELVKALAAPRTLWLMIPAGEPTHSTVRALADLLEAGDLVVDGGNSKFTDDAVHAELLDAHGVRYADCGVSGGVWGRTEGYGLMAGGDAADIERLMPVFDALRPEGPREEGFVHAGPVGAGHYAKMVHNGVEYGLMQAYAEGFEIMKLSSAFPGLKVDEIAEAWRYGSVVRSWLLDLVADGLKEDPELASLRGYVQDTGEGRWTVETGVEDGIPAPVITLALYQRFRSRMEDTFADRMLAMMRNQFGGHAVEQARAGS
jgi:6-phosphogluconate dehydrogenase